MKKESVSLVGLENIVDVLNLSFQVCFRNVFHVNIVPYVGGECKRGGLEIMHFFLVPTFQGSGYVVGVCETHSSKSGDDTNSRTGIFSGRRSSCIDSLSRLSILLAAANMVYAILRSSSAVYVHRTC